MALDVVKRTCTRKKINMVLFSEEKSEVRTGTYRGTESVKDI